MAFPGLTIVVPAGSSPVGEAVLRAYEHLVAADLVRPCVWVCPGSDGTPLGWLVGKPPVSAGSPETGGSEAGSQPDAPVGLLDLVATLDPRRIRVVALGLPGDRHSSDPAADLCERVWRAIQGNQSPAQTTTYYSLLVPSLDTPPGEPSAPSLDDGLLRGDPWLNVVVAPEDRADDASVAVPVSCGPTFAFHAATALASLSATWWGMDEGPADAWRAENPGETLSSGATRVVVMRSRSRSLIVPGTVDTVAGMVLARRRQWPVPPGAARSSHAPQLVGEVHRHFMAGPGAALGFSAPSAPVEPPVRSITVRELFAMLWRFITRRLPEIAREEVSSRIISAADRMEDWVTNRTLGPDSAFRLDRRGRVEAEGADLEAAGFLASLTESSGLELIRRTPPPDPAVWAALRQWSFSLVDDGRTPSELAELLSDGDRRVVVTGASELAPADVERGWWAPPVDLGESVGAVAESLRACDVWTTRTLRNHLEAMAAAEHAPPLGSEAIDEPAGPDGIDPGGDDDFASNGYAYTLAAESLAVAEAERSGSLMWKVAESMADAMDAARTTLDKLVAIVDNPPGGSLFDELERERRAARRRLVRTVVLSGLVIGLLTYVFASLRDDPVSVISTVIAGVVAWFGVVLGAIWRFAGTHFRLEHRKDVAVGLYDWACAAMPDTLVELSRLHLRYQQFLDWSEVISAMVHRPFGPPLAYQGRMHGTWLGGLHAHRVGEGELGSDTLTSLVSSQSADVFRPGWLSEAFDEVAHDVTGRYRYLSASSAEQANPDLDNAGAMTHDPIKHNSPRGFLRSRVVEGEVNAQLRAQRMSAVLERLSELPPDRLSDFVDGEPPGRWLASSIPLEQAAQFTLGLWSEQGLMNLPTDEARRLPRRSVWVPPSMRGGTAGGAAVHDLGRNPDSLVASVVCVDFSMLVSAQDLAVLGPEPTAPIERVPVPPPASAGMTRTLVGFTGVGPDESMLPDVGAVIEPQGPVHRPRFGGSYSFMAMVDGRPASYPEGKPVEYFVRVGVGPDDAFAMVDRALGLVADASGLSFRFGGTFAKLSEVPDSGGGLWIAFVEPDDGDGMGPFAIGEGVLGHGGVTVLGDRIVRGQAIVGNDAEAVPGFGPGHTVGSILLHEICHAMNLGHVNNQTEQMYPVATTMSPPGLGIGDHLGLWLLGVGRGST